MPHAPGVYTVHRLEPALGNGNVDGHKGDSDSIAQVDGL